MLPPESDCRSAQQLVLFDIDGTLVLTGGAGVRALNRAVEEHTAAREALSGIPVAGRTDSSILHEALRRIGRNSDERLLDDIRTRYVELLAGEIHQPGRGVKGVMPGIRDLLDALNTRPGVFLGLLTGNFAAAARIKLEYFDLWRYFRCGAFGDDDADRNALVPVALARARACGLGAVSNGSVLVVGDTPHDVACARAAGARAVAVATGSYSVEQLRQTGADHVFEDLSDTRAVLALL